MPSNPQGGDAMPLSEAESAEARTEYPLPLPAEKMPLSMSAGPDHTIQPSPMTVDAPLPGRS